jgi:hypothetical protein
MKCADLEFAPLANFPAGVVATSGAPCVADILANFREKKTRNGTAEIVIGQGPMQG